jgi:poly[(R)-3-hydroxyalkanoate] polymerase subunit PhaE
MERSAVLPDSRPESSGFPNPFGAFQAFGDMWARGSQAFFEGQQKWLGDLAKATLGEQKTAAQPDMSGFKAAQEAYSAALNNAMSLSSALMKNFGAASGGAADGETSLLPKMFDPQAWWAAAPDVEGVARLQEGPQLADVGQIERKLAAVYSAIVTLRQRGLEHQMVMTNAWMRAANKLITRLGIGADAAKAFSGSWRDLSSLWIQVANDELIATQRTEEYLASQRNLLKASTELRIAQQELAAFYSEMFGIPTRAEIDDVHKTLTDLRREVRALKRSKSSSEGAHG